jgi:UDP-sugar transporter A1/2/3
VYSVLLQLKILTTAAFAILMLGRHISWCKWRALGLLVLGCILVASPTFNKPPNCDLAALQQDEGATSSSDTLLGVAAVLFMVTISGYSACYFEQMLKGQKITIWERNFQLAFYSLFLLLVGNWVMINFGSVLFGTEYIEESTGPYIPFAGWTVNAVIISLFQAAGGLLVAATLKYADAVLKTLATSGSIVLSALLGKMLLGATLDVFVSIGCVATILGICNYTFDVAEST